MFKITYTRPDRVILLGVDGFDPKLVTELMDGGDMPNFERLRRTGSFAPLATTLPPETPVAWSAIATGANPGVYGIFDFIQREPATYKPVLAIYRVNTDNLLDRREKRYFPVRHAKGFWTVASEAGVPANAYRWPAAFPPEATAGRFLSGLGLPDVRGRLGQYTLFTTETRGPGASFKGAWHNGTWQGDTFRHKLLGPIVAGLTGRKESELDVVVRRLDAKRIALKIGDSAEATLAVGDWSAYIPVAFSAGLGKSIPAMVRAHLGALEPVLRLYVSTPEADPMNPYFPITAPDGFAKDLATAIGRYTTLGMPEDVNAMKDGTLAPEDFERAVLRQYEERRKQFEHELAAFERGVFAFVFDEGDRVQHMFWAARDKDHPRYTPEFAAKFGHVIPDVYRRADAALGKILETADEHTTVIVVSDHGFNTFRASVSLNAWLVEQGYMTLRTPDGRNGRELFADVDWSKTRAYSVGFASVYLNLKGRERDGIVAPGDAAKLCDELAAKLRKLADPVNGRPVCRGVYLGREAYHGPQAKNAPDIVVGFDAGYRAEDATVIGAAPAQVVAENTSLWTGDHLMDPGVVPGIFLSNRRLARPAPRVIDVAPTILRLVGVEKPNWMEGEALFE